MLSASQLRETGIRRLLGSGGALARNSLLQKEVEEEECFKNCNDIVLTFALNYLLQQEVNMIFCTLI